MKILKKVYKTIACSLASILFLSIAFNINAYAGTDALPNAKFTPVKARETLQKTVVRYESVEKLVEGLDEETKQAIIDGMNASKIDDINEVKGISDAEKALLLAVGADKVRSYVRDGDTLWIGTVRGLIRINTSEENPRDYVQYFRGPRYFGPLTNSNLTDCYDEITRLCSDNNNGVYVEAKLIKDGKEYYTVSHIKMEFKSLKEKADKYEEIVNKVIDRRGMVSDSSFIYTGNTFGVEEPEMVGRPTTSDNDGLWTSMYGIGEIYKYATLKRELGENHPETIEARKSAVRAVEAVLLLCHISGRGNGFPARSYMIDLPDDDPRDEVKYSTITKNGKNILKQNINGLWFKKDGYDENGNRVSVVQVTDDSYTKDPKSNDKVVANKLNFEGYPTDDAIRANPIAELTAEMLYTLTNLDPDGTKPELNNVKWVRDPSLDTDEDPDTSAYRIAADIVEEIPERLRHLYEDFSEYWRFGDTSGLPTVKDENLVYKADTSSDEMIGHMTLWYVANKYLIGDNPDADLKDLQNLIIKTAVRFMDHVLENKYRVMDATGKSTRWAKWWMEYFNGGTEPDPENDIWYCYGYEDVSVNSAEFLSFLKTSIILTEGREEYAQKNAAYKEAYEIAFQPYDKNNPLSGSGYGEGILNYINRRTDIIPAVGLDPKTANYTLTINYSDEELYAMAILPLIDSEFDPQKRKIILDSFEQWWDNMQRENNPLWTFLYQLAHPERTDIDLKNAVWFLERMPQYRIKYLTKNLDRDDIIIIGDGDRSDTRLQINRLLPPDERRIHKYNNNPFKPDDASRSGNNINYSGNSLAMDCGTVYTFPYWMGRYYGMIVED